MLCIAERAPVRPKAFPPRGRFSAPDHWNEYPKLLAAGAIFAPLDGPDWELFKSTYLQGTLKDVDRSGTATMPS